MHSKKNKMFLGCSNDHSTIGVDPPLNQMLISHLNKQKQ